ncbi:MAG: 6,7-dimethyl-8-ribityllumazine synthase [Planctomycetota bacterium]
MPKVIEGNLVGSGLKVAVAVARFNAVITTRLLDGALDGLRRHGVNEADVTVVWAPGSFEIPFLARQLADRGEHDAIICLGAVIRGATDHYGHVATAAARGVAEVALGAKLPVIFGVLTCDTLEQALERAGAKSNKGFDAALAALEMAGVMRKLKS